MRASVLCLALLLAGTPALAADAQTFFRFNSEGGWWSFTWQWRDGSGAVQDFSAAVEEGEAEEALGQARFLPLGRMNREIVEGLRVWAQGVEGVEFTFRARKKGLSMKAKGEKRSAVKKALRKAEAEAERLRADWLRSNRGTEVDGGISYDHARIVAETASELDRLAQALLRDTEGERAYVERALSFVQSIPYDRRARKGKDPGYFPPLALLARNQGDCDSKVVLFLALIRAAYPELELAVVYVPGHALAGVALPAQAGDKGFREEGTSFLFAEPVGPAQIPLGDAAPTNRRAARQGERRVVPDGA